MMRKDQAKLDRLTAATLNAKALKRAKASGTAMTPATTYTRYTNKENFAGDGDTAELSRGGGLSPSRRNINASASGFSLLDANAYR